MTHAAGLATAPGLPLLPSGGDRYNARMLPRRNPDERRPGAGAEDAELIRRARAGDDEAMDTLVQRHYRMVWNLALRLTGNHDDAEDILSETFVRIHNSLHSFRGDSHFSTWIHRIVKNVFLDDQKRRRIRAHTSLEEMVEVEDSSVSRQVEDPSPGPDWHVQQDERSLLIQQAVLGLPDNQRLMIAMYHFQHRSYEEIAEIMDLPIGTVKSRLNRARLALRHRLEPARELLES